MLRVLTVCPESFGANTYLVLSGKEALIVDPAVSVSAILEAIQREDAHPAGILLTHGHFDHLLSLDPLRQTIPLKASIHEADAVLLTDGRKNAFYDFFGKERVFGAADTLLTDGETIPLGEDTIRVIHTAGHTKGSVCYLCGDALLTGDTLFADNVGRCDLWGGDQGALIHSLARLRALDPKLTIYPGHGSAATLGNALDEAAYFISTKQ